MATVEQVAKAINDGAFGSDFAATIEAGGDIHGKIAVSDVGHRHPRPCGHVVITSGEIDCTAVRLKTANAAKAKAWIEKEIGI